MNIGLSVSDPGDISYIKKLFVKKLFKHKYFSLNFVDYRNINLRNIKNLSLVNSLNKKKFIDFLEKKKIDLVVLGSGQIKSKLHTNIIEVCKKHKVKVAFILDGFYNFAGRLKKRSKIILPDRFVVSDNLAKKDAIKEGIPKKIIRVGGNPVILEFLEGYRGKKNYNNLVFIADPLTKNFVKKHSKKNLPENNINELDVFKFLLKTILSIKKIKKIFFICHPKHDFIKIKKELTKIDKNTVVIRPNSKSKIKLIYNSKYIFGIASIMLLKARLLNKNVIAILTRKMLKKKYDHNMKCRDIKTSYFAKKIDLIKQIEKPFKMFNIKKIKKKYYPDISWMKN